MRTLAMLALLMLISVPGRVAVAADDSSADQDLSPISVEYSTTWPSWSDRPRETGTATATVGSRPRSLPVPRPAKVCRGTLAEVWDRPGRRTRVEYSSETREVSGLAAALLEHADFVRRLAWVLNVSDG